MFADCRSHRERRHHAQAELDTLRGNIPQLQTKIKEYENGALQKEYYALEQKQQGLRNERNRLNAEIQQARLKRDAWATNPSQQAQLEGMGWFGKRWVNAIVGTVNCDHIENEIKQIFQDTIPVKGEVEKLREAVGNWERKLSSASMDTMRKTTQELQRDVDNLKNQLNTINKEIQGHIDNYKKQKEAEAMAKIVGEDAKSKKEEKNKNTLLIAGAVGVGVVGLAVFVKMLSKPKAKKVTA